MPKLKLTDRNIKSIPAPGSGQVDVYDLVLPAFGVRVSTAGSRSFFIMTRAAGSSRLRRMTLGRYPVMGLAEARQAAREVIERASTGEDPQAATQSTKVAKARFGDVADEFLEKYARRRLRPHTIRDYDRTLHTVAVKWKTQPIGNIKKRDVLALIDDLEGQGKMTLADNSFSYLRKFFGWARERDYIEHSPVEGIRRNHTSKSRDRFLSKAELGDVWAALSELEFPYGPMLRILLLTGQRKGEVAGMQWSELAEADTGNQVWEIPANRTKNHRQHLVPITAAFEREIDLCPCVGDLVFTTTGKTPISGSSKCKRRLDEAVSRIRKKRGANDLMPHWTFHDWRRSFVTHANETLGFDPHVIEAVINHISGTRAGIGGVYNRAQYLSQRRTALEAWQEFVTQ
jgi:integrase